MADQENYLKRQEEAEAAHEAICNRCGACCGAYDNDPCTNLSKDKDGRYFCLCYASRLGPQRTASGKHFTCVEIRTLLEFHLSFSGSGTRCAYTRR